MIKIRRIVPIFGLLTLGLVGAGFSSWVINVPVDVDGIFDVVGVEVESNYVSISIPTNERYELTTQGFLNSEGYFETNNFTLCLQLNYSSMYSTDLINKNIKTTINISQISPCNFLLTSSEVLADKIPTAYYIDYVNREYDKANPHNIDSTNISFDENRNLKIDFNFNIPSSQSEFRKQIYINFDISTATNGDFKTNVYDKLAVNDISLKFKVKLTTLIGE